MKKQSSDINSYDLEKLASKLKKAKSDISNRLAVEKIAGDITKNLLSGESLLAAKIHNSLLLILGYMAVDKGSLMLLNPNNEKELIVVEAFSNGKTNTRIIGKRQKIAKNAVSSWVFKNKELLLLKNIDKDNRFPVDCKTHKVNYNSNSLLSFPLINQQNKVIGVLNLTDKKNKKIFTKKDMEATLIFVERLTPTLAFSRLNEQLMKKNEQLEKLQQVKTDLTNMVIHDIKGHLGEVISNIDILTYNKSLAPNFRECLDSAIEGCDSLLRLVLNLLDVSKMEEGKLVIHLSRFNLINTIEDMISNVGALASSKNLKISLAGKKKSFTITADKGLVGRIMHNLLLNAINYSKPDTEIIISLSKDKKNSLISIKDHGEGIPEDMYKKVFAKFEQLGGGQHGSSGTGLGLTFCKMAVEEHKGKIWVKSQLGKGSIFSFSLPDPHT